MTINAVRFYQSQKNYRQEGEQFVGFSGKKTSKVLIIPALLASLVSTFSHTKNTAADTVELTTKYLSNGSPCEQIEKRYNEFGNLITSSRHYFNNVFEGIDTYGRLFYQNIRGCADQEANVVTNTYRQSGYAPTPHHHPNNWHGRRHQEPEIVIKLPPFNFFIK